MTTPDGETPINFGNYDNRQLLEICVAADDCELNINDKLFKNASGEPVKINSKEEFEEKFDTEIKEKVDVESDSSVYEMHNVMNIQRTKLFKIIKTVMYNKNELNNPIYFGAYDLTKGNGSWDIYIDE